MGEVREVAEMGKNVGNKRGNRTVGQCQIQTALLKKKGVKEGRGGGVGKSEIKGDTLGVRRFLRRRVGLTRAKPKKMGAEKKRLHSEPRRICKEGPKQEEAKGAGEPG